MASSLKYRDPDTAQYCARAFRQTALALLDAAPKGTGDGARQASPEALGSIVCAATNLSLALELYLKAAHIRARTGFNLKTHRLDTLFSNLPENERTDVSARYEALLKQVQDHQIQFIDLARGPVTTPAWQIGVRLRDGLVPMLERSRDVFRSWRYIFEIELPRASTHQVIRFEHSLMHIACEALERHLNQVKAL